MKNRIRKITGLAMSAGLLLGMGCICKEAAERTDAWNLPVVKGDLFTPSMEGKAVMVAPGFINTGLYERDFAIMPDGNAVYYGLFAGNRTTIMETTRGADGTWSEPRVAPFASDERYNHLEPCLSMDGNQVYFLSTAPPPGMEPRPGWGHQNIWMAWRLEDGSWSAPEPVGSPVNSDDGEFFPSLTKHGTLYFTRQPGGNGPGKLYRSPLVDGVYTEPERLPDTVNQYKSLYNACIHPDETFLLACVNGVEDGTNQPGYYVFFRSADDRWSEAVRLPETINFPEQRAISINMSTDGKWVFFASALATETDRDDTRLSVMLELAMQPGNGRGDIYAIPVDVVHALRPEGF